MFSRQSFYSVVSVVLRCVMNMSMASLSVLNYVRLRYKFPSVSMAAIMFTR